MIPGNHLQETAVQVDKILLLDIDGVLNDHRQWLNKYCTIDPDKVRLLNRVVDQSKCRIVLASAWRYMVLGGEMTLKGFGYMLMTYGASKEVADALYAHLPRDVDPDDLHDRGKLAWGWLASRSSITHAVALDDGDAEGRDLGYEACGIPVVRPKPRRGLTWKEAERVIELFSKPGERPWTTRSPYSLEATPRGG